ncbi:MAG TPA: EamA family transporter [Mycobacteriales bacterium]|nr:EamA family transporter [Mycobacteriales bacterium]
MAVPVWKTWTALGIVYVVWGSTYLAISYAVDGLPPLLTAAGRFLVSALVLGAFVAVRRGSGPFRATRRQWLGAGAVGLLLLLGGNGAVMLAEDAHLPSGLTALLVAGVPLFVVALRWLLRDRPTPRTLLGVGIGFVGLAVLLLPGSRPAGVSLGAAATVVVGSLLWSTGSVLAGQLELPKDPLVVTIGEMVGGAAGLALVGAARGEHLTASGAGPRAWLALAYLVVFGSVIAFTAYSWLLQTAPVSQAATYAYVNPVVAVGLGALVAGERVTATSLVGGLVTLLAVYVVVTEEGRRRRRVTAVQATSPEPYVPTDRQGRLRSSAT